MSQDQSIDILVVDDNEDDLLMIQEAFEEAKLINVVHVAHDGQEAIAFLRKQGPHANAPTPGLVLLDINMPKMDGFEVLDELKHNGELRSMPVVMLTTSTREEDVVRSYCGGACSYISKPVDFQKLREVTKQFALYWALVARIPPRNG